jgi:hypothetical protein
VLEQFLGDVGVFGGHHPVEELHDGHVDTEVLHHVSELDTDGTGPGDDDGARQLVVENLLLVGDHVLRYRDPGQHPGDGTGGDDEVVEADRRLTVFALDGHRGR